MSTAQRSTYHGERIIRERERATITGLSRPAWYRLERAGKAPRRHPITERTVGWALSDLERWVALRLRGEDWSEAA
jgi:prophage regulatory protein